MPSRKHPHDLRILQMGEAIDASIYAGPPHTVDDMMQHFLAASQAHAKHNMTIKTCKRPCGRVVTHIKMADTGKTVLVTVERNNRLIRVLELV